MGIRYSNLLSYDVVSSLAVGLFILLLIWFIQSVRNNNNKNMEHDKELFKQPPSQYGDCPICFLRLPYLNTGRRYYTCCGKVICNGCVYAPVYDDRGNEVDNPCPFCRTPRTSSNEELNEMEKKRMQADDNIAIFNIGVYYRDGINGFPQDYTKALELWHRAGELGHAAAYRNIGFAYEEGRGGVEIDEKKANHYYRLAAIGGDVDARFKLGYNDIRAGNIGRALKHYKITAAGGHFGSLKMVQELYRYGDVTKEDYRQVLQLYQAYLDEIKSKQRDEAAEEDEEDRYY